MSIMDECYKHTYKLSIMDNLWTMQQAVAYAFEQVKSSDIDVLGETREENLKLLAQAYYELEKLNLGRHECYIEESVLLKALKGEL